MLTDLLTFPASLRLTVANRSDLLLEIAALRQQLEVLQRRGGRSGEARLSSSSLTRSLAGIVRAIVYFGGGVPVGSIAFIQRISREHPLWGEDRIAQEMKLKLGIEHSASTIRRYMITEARSPSSTWRSFLRNHASEIYALDLTPQVMWDFSIGYVWVLIDHRTRRLVHIGMTRNPTLDWVKQQVRDACPWEGPRFISSNGCSRCDDLCATS